MPSACFDANSNVSTHWKHAEGMSLRYGVIVLGNLMRFFYQEFILSSGVFRRETASGFYPWCKVDSPRKRVAEGLCGWRHGNSFPMSQSAQSHRQMRSIPLCSKAVFCVFVFDSIHDSITMHNLYPGIFHRTVSPWIRAFLVGVGNKKRPDFSSRVLGIVGVDGFEPPTLCL